MWAEWAETALTWQCWPSCLCQALHTELVAAAAALPLALPHAQLPSGHVLLMPLLLLAPGAAPVAH